jgi:hypothetical protein
MVNIACPHAREIAMVGCGMSIPVCIHPKRSDANRIVQGTSQCPSPHLLCRCKPHRVQVPGGVFLGHATIMMAAS